MSIRILHSNTTANKIILLERNKYIPDGSYEAFCMRKSQPKKGIFIIFDVRDIRNLQTDINPAVAIIVPHIVNKAGYRIYT